MHSTSMNGLLLVNSDGVERPRLKRELEACGWIVFFWPASDEAAALRIISERSRDLGAAILDLQLPGFQGRRIIAELEQLDPEPICVAISGKLSPMAVEAYRRMSKSPLPLPQVWKTGSGEPRRHPVLRAWRRPLDGEARRLEFTRFGTERR